MITGVSAWCAKRSQENPEAVDAFLKEYAASTEYVNANPAEAAEDRGAGDRRQRQDRRAAIPACNIVCITGEEMVTKASGYIDALYEQNPEAVGGKPADESYFYIAASEE